MTQYTFTPKDFKAFDVEGLDERMEALNKYIRPQLHQLGDYFSKYFTSQTGEHFMHMLLNMRVEVLILL